MGSSLTERPRVQVPSSASQRLLEIDPAAFSRDFNRRPFLFRHRLEHHPLFQLDSLVALAQRLPPDQVMHRRAKVPIGSNFDRPLLDRDHPLTVDEVLQDLQCNDAYVFLQHAEVDPVYNALMRQLMAEFRLLAEPIDPGICTERIFIFIVSPGAVTPYHQDRVTNFLCQVRGTKTMQLWDWADRSIVSEEDLERLFAREDLPKPAYRPEFGPKAQTFALSPGLGVHHPLAAPHAAVCGDEVSIAVGFTWLSRRMNRRIAAHRTNAALRRFGVRPRPVGESAWGDRLKEAAFGARTLFRFGRTR